jgi:hypothetical protein
MSLSEYMGYLEPSTNEPTILSGFDWSTYSLQPLAITS